MKSNTRWGGLTTDNLLATTLAKASGQVLNANQSENADLLSACKGATGRNFGINSSFTFQLQPVPRSQVLIFGFEYKGLDSLNANKAPN